MHSSSIAGFQVTSLNDWILDMLIMIDYKVSITLWMLCKFRANCCLSISSLINSVGA